MRLLMRKACQHEGLPNCLSGHRLEENSEFQVNQNGETCFVISGTVIGNPKIN